MDEPKRSLRPTSSPASRRKLKNTRPEFGDIKIGVDGDLAKRVRAKEGLMMAVISAYRRLVLPNIIGAHLPDERENQGDDRGVSSRPGAMKPGEEQLPAKIDGTPVSMTPQQVLDNAVIRQGHSPHDPASVNALVDKRAQQRRHYTQAEEMARSSAVEKDNASKDNASIARKFQERNGRPRDFRGI